MRLDGYSVKPLEWDSDGDAVTTHGIYTVIKQPDKRWRPVHNGFAVGTVWYITRRDARAACFEDHKQRIMLELEATDAE